MTDLIIFFVGVLIFGMTVYGAVVSGGLAMHVQHMRENPEIERRTNARRAAKQDSEDPAQPALPDAA